MYKVAVVGCTGNIGLHVLESLAEREFPISEIVGLSSDDSKGKEVSFGNRVLRAESLTNYDFKGTDIAIFAAGSKIAEQFAPIAADAGCVVIDNSSFYRNHKDVPLIVPEVNREALKYFKKTNIIANPNCSTIQLAVALKPLNDLSKIKRIVVSTYQSVSGAGREAMDELYNQTKATYTYDMQDPVKFTKRIAFNLIPHIDIFTHDGHTKEELKMMTEIDKIFAEPMNLTATCVRVPVFVGHSEAVNIEFEDEVTLEEIIDSIEEAEGLMLYDRRQDGGYATPFEVSGDDNVYVSRIRKDPTVANGYNMWVVADNMRKGGALNSVQIAECLISDGLI